VVENQKKIFNMLAFAFMEGLHPFYYLRCKARPDAFFSRLNAGPPSVVHRDKT